MGPGQRLTAPEPKIAAPAKRAVKAKAAPVGAAKPVRVSTPHGPATFVLDKPAGDAELVLVLGHGAGGDVDAVDLVAVRDAVVSIGVAVARVTQPYRVAGRRAPAPAHQLDAALLAVSKRLRRAYPQMILGGRSSGARVACRTATAAGALGVVALAFPLHPPGRPEVTRADELPVDLPTLVVNGDRDAFGVPVAAGAVEVVVLPGETHALAKRPAEVGSIVVTWLQRNGWA